MAESAVEAFAGAIRRAETGAEGDYRAVRGLVRGTARLLGAYGIPSDNWAVMAADAGLTGARWQDPRAQDAVATATFTRLYDKYRDWRLVAVAWKAGEELAEVIADNPGLLSEPSLKPVQGYAQSVMQNVNEQITVNPDSGVSRETFPITFDDMTPRTAVGGGSTPVGASGGESAEDVLRRRLYAMRDRVRNMTPSEEAAAEQTIEPEIGTARMVGGDTRVSEGERKPLRRLLGGRKPSASAAPMEPQ